MDISQDCNVREPVISVTSRLRMFEDFNLASRLQDQEFDYHYALNRAERQLVGNDTRTSRKVQENEDRIALFKRQQELSEIAANDERLALYLQHEIEENERRQKEKISQLDATFARTLELRERRKMDEKFRNDMEAADAMYARELQNYYNARLKRSKRRQDEAPRRSSLLPSFFAKSLGKQRHQNGSNSCQRDRPRNEYNYEWADDVDENTQNELNVQMASVAARSLSCNDPPPAYSSLDHTSFYVLDENNPLATIATRDSTSPTAETRRSISGSNGIATPCNLSLVRTNRNNNSFRTFCHLPNDNGGRSQQHRQEQNSQNSSCTVFNNGLSVLSSSNTPVNNSINSDSIRHGNDSRNYVNDDHSFENFSESQLLTRFHPTNPFITDLVNNQSSHFVPSEHSETSDFTHSDDFGLSLQSPCALGLTTN